MEHIENIVSSEPAVKVFDFLPHIGIDSVREEIMDGLRAKQKYISPKFFYDGKGSELFEEITRLEEYYPTLTEKGIIKTIAGKLDVDFAETAVVELGSGDCSKITLLLEQLDKEMLRKVNYIPVDISRTAVEKSTSELLDRFPLKSVTGIVADFNCQLGLIPQSDKRLFCFFGSTIGNFSPEEARMFLKSLGASMNPGDSLLLGMDMVKDVEVLEDAYNDKKGVTARFNKNILNVLNNMVGTDFDPTDFEHHAFFNKKRSRIEMHLRALREVEVSSDENTEKIIFKEGEAIHTENSHKFSVDDVEKFAEWAGLKMRNIFTDNNKWFSIAYYIKK